MGIDFLAAAALAGQDPYDKPHPKLRSLGGTWAPAEFHVLVPATERRSLDAILRDPKIRVATSPRATSEELTLRRALAFYGNPPEKIRAGGGSYVATNYNEMISAFQDGQIDMVWGAGSRQTGFALEIQTGRRPAKLLAFPEPLMAELHKYGYGKGEIKAGTYSAIQPEGKAVPVAVLEAVILATSDLSDDAAYRITKTLIESRPRFAAVHDVLTGYDPAVAWKDQPVPLHPGAEKAYRELGFQK
jgi:TRAP transporter TAXI family solute receptor